MTIQVINHGMTNRAYQKNNQTMPMTKTSNVKFSSPVVDNNITYSGNNSSRTVSFAGLGSRLLKKVGDSLTKLCIAKDRARVLKIVRESKSPEEVVDAFTTKLLPLTYLDKTSVITRKNANDILGELSKSKSPKEVAESFTQLLQLTYLDKTSVITRENAIDILGGLSKSNSPKEVVESFTQLFQSTYQDGTAVFTRESGTLLKELIRRSNSPKILAESITKLLRTGVIRRENKFDVFNMVLCSNNPEKVFEDIIKLSQATRETGTVVFKLNDVHDILEGILEQNSYYSAFPEEVLACLSKLLQTKGGTAVITRENIFNVINTLYAFNAPKESLESFTKLLPTGVISRKNADKVLKALCCSESPENVVKDVLSGKVKLDSIIKSIPKDSRTDFL